MFNSHHYSGVAELLPLLLLALVAVSNAADPCYNTVPQPGRLCTSVRCAATSNTTAFPLPAGETYASFYSWVLGILGVDGGDVKMAYVDYTTTDPNIYFAPNQVDCYVNVSFVYEVAAYRNRMGVFKFNRASPPTSASSVVSPSTLFAETSVDCTRTDGGSCLAPGSTLTLGPFSSSDGVGFYLDPNQVCGATGRFYSVGALNIITSRWRRIPAMHGRLVAVLRDPNTKRVYFGWEDSPTGSDSDYNDVMFSVTSSCALDYTKIPCAGVATCRNPRQQFVQATCECTCMNQTSCPAPLVYDTDLCACACPATTCDAACPLNSQTCQCECPPSPTPTSSPSRTPSRSPSPSISTSPSTSPTLSSTPTPSNTPSNTPSPSTSPTPTPSPTRTPSSSPSPSISNSPSTSPTPSSTPTPSNTPSNSPTPSNTPSPSTSPTASSSPSASPTSSTSPSSSPSTSASPSPSNTPSPSASPSSSASPTPSSSLTPSPSASPSNSATPTPSSSVSPTPTPSISASPSSSPAPSSVASAYNVLLVGRPDVEFDFDMSNGQVEGRVAVNGGLRALGFGMGSRVVPCDASTAALVVDGAESRVNFQGGLQCGNLVAEPSARVTALPGFNSGNNRLVRGDVFSLTGLDFMAEATRAQATADAVCSGGGVAATVSPWREITFQGSASAPAQQSFVVQAADLSQAASARFVFAQPSAVESVVVAVMGGQVSGVSLSNFGINNGGVSGGRITFVVCDAPRVTLRGFGLEANLLAVDSQVTLENGQITGRIIAQTLTGSGGIRLP